MHRILSIGSTKSTLQVAGMHTSATRLAISKFNLPAMSPTMTEGTIHKWQKKEGEAFSAGDVLLELETDKAQIDVEAPEDGILAKIVLSEGQKAPVNTLIALLAEEGDDLSNIEIPKDESTSSNQPKEEKKVETQVSSTPTQPLTPVTPMSHHDIDTSKLKKPLSPSVLGLIMRHHIKDIESIKASGPGGRILKGDVLGHLGLITPQPAPKPTYSVAPPRDQIEFAKPADEKNEKLEKKEKVETLPNFIERQVSIDAVLDLQNGNQQINGILSKAAAMALQEVNGGKIYTGKSDGGIIIDQQRTSYAGKYLGGAFKVFHLAEPTYDFISDSYVTSKPYTLKVNEIQQQIQSSKKKETMVDIIDYLGGNTSSSSYNNRLLNNNNTKKNGHHVEIKLQGGTPGKIISDKKAKMFLDRLEYYIRHPNEIIL